MDTVGLEHKFDAVGYGIFIPIFFVSSGMTLDLKAIAQNPLRLLTFFLLPLVVRGLPSLLVYRRALPARPRVGVLSVLVFPLAAVMLHRSAPITPADMGIGTAEAAARTSTPPDDPGQPASQDG